MSVFFEPRFKAIVRFLAMAFLLFVLWFVIHDFWLLKHTRFVQEVIRTETLISAQVLNWLGFQKEFLPVNNQIMVDGQKGIRIGSECSGLVLFALFAGFIVAFPGNRNSKLWYIPVGILAIYILNIVRIVALTLNFVYYKSSFSFNHHVTFTYLVYGFIFLLWWYWVNKYGNLGKQG